MSKTARFPRPSSYSFTAGLRIPSWKISVASVDIEPGTLPPTSFQWAMFDTQATSRPSWNTGAASTMSLRWVTPPK